MFKTDSQQFAAKKRSCVSFVINSVHNNSPSQAPDPASPQLLGNQKLEMSHSVWRFQSGDFNPRKYLSEVVGCRFTMFQLACLTFHVYSYKQAKRSLSPVNCNRHGAGDRARADRTALRKDDDAHWWSPEPIMLSTFSDSRIGWHMHRRVASSCHELTTSRSTCMHYEATHVTFKAGQSLLQLLDQRLCSTLTLCHGKSRGRLLQSRAGRMWRKFPP